MITVFARTFIVYFLLLLFMKILGKRQVGELEISELVSTLLISEIAAVPIENFEIPLVNTAIPLFLIIFLEIILSFTATKCEWFKRFITGKPSILISRGVLDVCELAKTRLSVEELVSELRLKGIGSIEEVDYAILEQNGQISVIQKKLRSPVTSEELGLSVSEEGISHLIIVDGHLKEANLIASKKDISWLNAELKRIGKRKEDIFLMSVNDAGKTYIINKKEKK